MKEYLILVLIVVVILEIIYIFTPHRNKSLLIRPYTDTTEITH